MLKIFKLKTLCFPIITIIIISVAICSLIVYMKITLMIAIKFGFLYGILFILSPFLLFFFYLWIKAIINEYKKLK